MHVAPTCGTSVAPMTSPSRPLAFAQSPLCELVFAGRYSELLKQTVDGPRGTYDASDTPFIVGALAFSGRQDEAVAALRAWVKTSKDADDPTVRVASHFFLCVGECRSGRYAAALSHAKAAVSSAVLGDALHAFFAHQAIGLLRHFMGRFRSAARHAGLARQAAFEARFPYGRMLAMDLLGHALVLTGQIHAGLAILEQSAALAESLGLVANAGGPRTSIATIRARVGDLPDAQGALESLVAGLRLEDAYSRRMVLSELAIQQAFAGRGIAARASIDEAARIALPDGDRRAKIRLLVADAIVARHGRGSGQAIESLDLARTMLDPALDDGLDVEVSWAELLVRGESALCPDTKRRVAALASRTHAGRARILAAWEGPITSVDPHAEDRIAKLVHLIAHDRDEARHAIVSQRLWGLLPRFVGLPPGRRIYVLHAESLLVVEDYGELSASELPGAVLVRLLEAIATRPTRKDDLLRQVWGIRVYRPDRHDTLIHTTISRLRSALGVAGAWIRASDAGYGLEGATLHALGAFADEPEPVAGDVDAAGDTADGGGDVDGAASSEPRPTGKESAKAAAERRRAEVLRLCASELSTSEIAAALRISEMTAFRLLSTMAKDGFLVRTGQGKRTRYKVPS